MAGLHLPSSGLWIEPPQGVVAFGSVRFTAVGLSEPAGHHGIARNALPGAKRETASRA